MESLLCMCVDWNLNFRVTRCNSAHRSEQPQTLSNHLILIGYHARGINRRQGLLRQWAHVLALDEHLCYSWDDCSCSIWYIWPCSQALVRFRWWMSALLFNHWVCSAVHTILTSHAPDFSLLQGRGIQWPSCLDEISCSWHACCLYRHGGLGRVQLSDKSSLLRVSLWTVYCILDYAPETCWFGICSPEIRWMGLMIAGCFLVSWLSLWWFQWVWYL